VTTTAEMIQKAARGAMKRVLTPTGLAAAAALYSDLAATATRHGVDPTTLDLGRGVVEALKKSWQSQPEAVDPLALVQEVVRAAAQELDQEAAALVVEGPVAVSPVRAYVVLARQDQTPAWGPTGTAPLVVRLDREDWGGGTLGPWEWTLFPDHPGGAGVVATVLAPPPSPQVATEIGQIASWALTGKL
jgi:hypothetical protein